jgi:hypothetical protein
VKDWKRSTLVAANRDAVELETPRGRVTEANPLRQARDYAFELVALMQQDPTLVRADGPFQGKLLFPYGWGVVFSHLRQADLADTAWGDFAQVFPPHQTLLRDDLDESVNPGDFFNRLWGLFTVHYPHTLTLPQRDRIRWHLFPEIRVHLQEGLDFGGDAAAAAPQAPLLPDLMQVMDLQQEQIARTLGEGHRVIHGVAGSGKTMILIYRAQQLAAAARPDQPILVLCFNRALADRIDAPLRQRGVDERVQVRTFHSWCQDLVNSYQLYVPDARPRRPLRLLADTVEKSIETGFIPGGQYMALLIDEAHDFEEAWLRLATAWSAPARRACWCCTTTPSRSTRRSAASSAWPAWASRPRAGPASSSSTTATPPRSWPWPAPAPSRCCNGARRRGRPRGPASGAARQRRPARPHAGAHQRPRPGGGSAAAGRAHRRPGGRGRALNDVAALFRAKYQMAPLEQALKRAHIAFDSMNTRAFRRFDWSTPSVKLITLHSAKGLEFPHVFIGGLQALPMKDETLDDAVRLLYVGMTRATSSSRCRAAGSAADRAGGAGDGAGGGDVQGRGMSPSGRLPALLTGPRPSTAPRPPPAASVARLAGPRSGPGLARRPARPRLRNRWLGPVLRLRPPPVWPDAAPPGASVGGPPQREAKSARAKADTSAWLKTSP